MMQRGIKDDEDDMKSKVAFGFWTCAAIYAAIGIIGVFLIAAQPSIAYSSDGYGTVHAMAAKQPIVRP